MPEVDAIVVGAGPNGLAAAITLARAGCSVQVIEAKDTIGGGARTLPITLPGFRHDICSAVHPLGLASPFLRTLPLHDFGLEWIHPDIALAHPFDDGTAVIVDRSIETTARALGAEDGTAYRRLVESFARNWDKLALDILGPLPIPPRHPLLMARFGLSALQSAHRLSHRLFKGARARAVFAGMAAHAIMPLNWIATASFGMVLGILAHAVGWPIPRGGSQSIVDAMAAYLKMLGGDIVTSRPVHALHDLPSARAILFDVTPRQLVRIAGDHLPAGYRRQLTDYRYGPGVYKLDWALAEPIPWRAPEAHRAGTVHLGASFEEIARSESLVWQGKTADVPFTLIAQQSQFDATRAPEGRHTGWAYCHVPNGSTENMTERIENQIERFAPGFKERILMRHACSAPEMESYNPNYIGGDINGGVQDIRQLFTRPVPRPVPYSTPLKGVFLCSSSTPPGGGVHGMCGFHAAQAALRTMK